MIVHQIQDLSNQTIVDLLKQGLQSVKDENLIKNYHPDFSKHNSNLFYLLNKGRYKKGTYYVLEDQGKYIGSAGWNHYNDDIALLLTRAYVAEEYRQKSLLATHVLENMINSALHYNKLWITCNGYNMAIYNGFVRLAEDRSAGLMNGWSKIYKKFKPIGLHTVYYTEQYVVEYQK